VGLRELAKVIEGIAFPRACAACQTPGPLLCDTCADETPVAPIREIEGFNRCVAAFTHTGAARAALLAAKLGGERRGLAGLAERIPRIVGVDAVTHVPDTYRTRASRGGSIAGALARAYARQIEGPHLALLRKQFETADLGGASRAARANSTTSAFAPVRASPRVVALVDDVVTTGATARSCGQALVAAGATDLVLVTFTSAVLRTEEKHEKS
jgi:predicted amidophosphoribosyltransferase